MSDLESEVAQLKEQVKKMQALLASTGQQVLQLQVENRKNKINDIDTKTAELNESIGTTAPKPPLRSSEYVTESDLGDMVVELHDQLRLLDERNIRRVLNSRSSSKLVPLPNTDGEENPNFPKTIAEVQQLNDQQLFDQWNFFEMLPNGEKLEDLLDTETTNDAKAGNVRVIQEIYESFVKYIGINPVEYPRQSN